MRGKFFKGKMLGILAVFLVLCMAAGYAEEERKDASGQWKYVLEEAGARITGCVGEPAMDLVFPRELDGHPVTTIGSWASDDYEVNSVTIPADVTSIGANAFAWYCIGLTSITIPDSVTSIGDRAFYACELTSITIPASVTDIAGNPFDACPIQHIDVAAANPVYEQIDGVLMNKQQKTLVSYPGARKGAPYAVPEGIQRVGEAAFTNCGELAEVIIPDTVTSIGDYAFWGCVGLSSVTIPDSVTSIGYMAFYDCDKLDSITIPDSVTSIGEEAFFKAAGDVTLRVARGSYAERYAEANGLSYTYVTDNGIVEGLTIDNLATRSGPSTKYSETGTYKVKGEHVRLLSRAYDDNNLCWVHCEVAYGNKLRRVYTGLKRFDIGSFELDGVPVEALSDDWVKATSTSKALYGPGDGYDTYGSLTVDKGQTVTVVAVENGYAQVEWRTSAQRYRGWVPTHTLDY